MKVLVVSSIAGRAVISYVSQQARSVSELGGIEYDHVGIESGLVGYASGYFSILKKLITGKFDLVHAHYGLSGLVACMQFIKPVVVTFHGCDVNDLKTRRISKVAYRLSAHSVFVEKEMPVKLAAHNKTSIIPCGVNIDIFQPIDKLEARKILGLIPDERIVLFSSEFDVPVKNYPLAKAACAKFDNIKLIELKNFTREQVNLLLNACDLLLLTSIREGSPQVVKEAMACNCPIVSTDVGDVRNNIQDLQGCYIASFDPVDVAEKIKLAFNADRTGGRKRLIDLGLDSVSTALRIIELYKNILKSNY